MAAVEGNPATVRVRNRLEHVEAKSQSFLGAQRA
jgi:hypothetical protein